MEPYLMAIACSIILQSIKHVKFDHEKVLFMEGYFGSRRFAADNVCCYIQQALSLMILVVEYM